MDNYHVVRKAATPALEVVSARIIQLYVGQMRRN